jgi:hypothetical protein
MSCKIPEWRSLTSETGDTCWNKILGMSCNSDVFPKRVCMKYIDNITWDSSMSVHGYAKQGICIVGIAHSCARLHAAWQAADRCRYAERERKTTQCEGV